MSIFHHFSNPWKCQLFPLMNSLLMNLYINSHSLSVCVSVSVCLSFLSLPFPHSFWHKHIREIRRRSKKQYDLTRNFLSFYAPTCPANPPAMLAIFTHLSPTYFFLLERKSHPLCPITVLCFFGLLHIPISNCLSYK